MLKIKKLITNCFLHLGIGQRGHFHFLSIFVLGFVIAASSSSCRTPPKSPEPAVVPINTEPKDISYWGQKLTLEGSNSSPRFFSSGRQIVFASKNRRTHLKSQIYIYDLDLKRERRITYQDGEVFSPLVTKDSEELYYSSTTDEIKEKPLSLYPELAGEFLPGAEIYSSDVKGLEIDRLTSQEGYQGDLSFTDHKQSELVLISSFKGQFSIGTFDIEHERLTTVGKSLKDPIRSPLKLGPNKFLWLQKRAMPGQDSIQLGIPGGSPQSLATPPAEIQSMRWWSQDLGQVILSARVQGQSNFGIYFFDTKSKCFKQLLLGTLNAFDPEVSTDRMYLTLSLEEKPQQNQIYVRSTQDFDLSCSSPGL